MLLLCHPLPYYMEYYMIQHAAAVCVAQVSKDGAQFSAYCSDGRVRVWWFRSGKLRRTYDESLEVSVRKREKERG